MKKLNILSIVVCAIFFQLVGMNDAFSAVHFVTKEGSISAGRTDRPCPLDGYTYTSQNCKDGQTLYDKCPTGNYYKVCKCDTKLYPYAKSDCTDNKSPTGNSCNGTNFAKCECDTSKYKVLEADCPAPKVLSGKACEGKYESCACPAKYNKTCPSPAIGVGECDGKYESCKCPDSWSSCSTMGAQTGAQVCDVNGEKKYSECCTCVGFTKDLTDANAVDYNTCGCNSNYKQVKTCKEGYAIENGSCVKIGCRLLLKSIVEKNVSFSSYGVYEGQKLASSKKTYIVAEDVTAALPDFYNVNTVSAAAFLSSINSSSAEVKAAKEVCEGIPTIKFTSNPVLSSPVTFTALKLSGSTIYNDSKFTCTNCSIDLYAFHSTNSSSRKGSVSLAYNSALPNTANMLFKASTLNIDSQFKSVGYNFDITSQLTIGSPSGSKYSYPVVFEGISSRNKITIKTPFTRIRYALTSFKYANVFSKKTLVGVYGTPTTAEKSLGADDDGMTAVTLYQTDWKMYDADSGNINNYTLYMGRLSILGFKKGLDADSNDNSYGNKIAWSNGQNSARCRVRGTQNHQKNGTNSCKNRIGNRDFYYLDTSGNRQKGNTGSYNSEWCKGSGGDGPFGGNSVGKIYLNKYSWVNGGKRLRLECY